MSAPMSGASPSEVASDTTMAAPPAAAAAPAASGPPSFPDGGWLAWTQCAGAFILFFNTWGMVSAFGAYQQYYQSVYITTEGPSRISWIGSLQGFFLLISTVIAGPLLDQGHARALLATGSFLIVFGMMMTSLCTQYWQLILAQGLVVGLGNGCLFMPCIGILPTYFNKKRSMTMGIAASGSSLGGIVYAIAFHHLVNNVGFGWANRIIAFIMLATQMVPLLGMRQRLTPPKVRSFTDTRAWKEPAFMWFYASAFLAFVGLYIPFFHLQEQAARQNIVTGELNFYLLAILNAGSFVGRVVPNIIADKAGPLNTLAPCTLLAGVMAFVWIAVQSTGGIIAFALLYGAFSGAYVSLSPTVTAMLSPTLQILGTRVGMASVPMALGLLIGNPIAGAIVGNGSASGYIGLKAFCAAWVMMAAFTIFMSRVFYGQWRRQYPS